MKLNDTYDDLILEVKKRLMDDEKFEWVTSNIGEWLYEIIMVNHNLMSQIPYYIWFRTWLSNNYNQINRNNNEYMLEAIRLHYGEYLNNLREKDSDTIIDDLKKQFPSLKMRIESFGKKEKNPNERRGRKPLEKKPKITSAIKSGRLSTLNGVNNLSRLKPISTTKPNEDPKITIPLEPTDNTSDEPKKRGRKPFEGETHGLTYQQRHIMKKEGLDGITRIENRIETLDNETTRITRKIIELEKEIQIRKKILGLNDEINESLVKLKSDFKRFL